MDTSQSTEEKIFDAAREVFYKQGYDGARMQEIARKAGINQSMLHYYFRTKEKLFDAVFRVAAAEDVVQGLCHSGRGHPSLSRRSSGSCIPTSTSFPVIHTFPRSSCRSYGAIRIRLKSVVGEGAKGAVSRCLDARFRTPSKQAKSVPSQPGHLIANMLALSVFPFIARPMLQTGLGLDADGYDVFLAERKVVVTRFILNALKP